MPGEKDHIDYECMGQTSQMNPANLQDFDNRSTTYLEMGDAQTAERI